MPLVIAKHCLFSDHCTTIAGRHQPFPNTAAMSPLACIIPDVDSSAFTPLHAVKLLALYVSAMTKSFYRCSFDPVHGGEMLQEEYVRFLKFETKPR